MFLLCSPAISYFRCINPDLSVVTTAKQGWQLPGEGEGEVDRENDFKQMSND